MSSTVVSRTFRSIPFRDASATWVAIVDLLTRGKDSDKRRELFAVSGVAATLIADETPKSAPIVVTCDGPRTRIYCVFDDNALDESEGNEDGLAFDALEGDWAVSLPCTADELSWVRAQLKKHSTRITARDLAQGISTEDGQKAPAAAGLVLDIKGFLK